QRYHDRDHAAQDGPANEEVLDLLVGRFSVHLPLRAAGAGAAAESPSATGRTGRPGPIFCTPSTTTRSPGFSPLSMIQRLPLQGPGLMSRACTVSPLATTYTNCRPRTVCTARTGTASAPVWANPTRRARTNEPGTRRRSALVNTARNSCVPVAKSSE